MPVYNAAPYVQAALQSVLGQSFQAFEVLIYDDASTDDTIEKIEAYKDERIRLFKKIKNTGYTDSLIQGLLAARGKYIARMDADDICQPQRFKYQVDFLDANSAYGIVGSAVEAFDSTGAKQLWQYPQQDEAIRAWLMCNAPFAHPAVMMRRQVLLQCQLTYDKKYEPCEDYKLWFELLKHTKGHNIVMPLLQYRLHPQQTIAQKKALLIQQSNEVRKEWALVELGIVFTQTQVQQHYLYFNQLQAADRATLEAHANWRRQLTMYIKQAGKTTTYQPLVDEYWVRHLKMLTQYNFSCIKYWMDVPVLKRFSIGASMRYWLKCLLHHQSKPIR
ncbi:MAG: hypothetical protein RL172_2480 [Bacteroidota bacterium]|jgi:hypothetical protein